MDKNHQICGNFTMEWWQSIYNLLWLAFFAEQLANDKRDLMSRNARLFEEKKRQRDHDSSEILKEESYEDVPKEAAGPKNSNAGQV